MKASQPSLARSYYSGHTSYKNFLRLYGWGVSPLRRYLAIDCPKSPLGALKILHINTTKRVNPSRRARHLAPECIAHYLFQSITKESCN